jgi:S1-C subfamily serine protease
MNRRHLYVAAGIGCGAVGLLVIAALVLVLVVSVAIPQVRYRTAPQTAVAEVVALRDTIVATRQPAVAVAPPTYPTRSPEEAAAAEPGSLTALYHQANPGVVFIGVVVERLGQRGQGSGSGFILDDEGHIVTNNHVVSGATNVTVAFYDGFEENAEVVGADADSDLAVIRVDRLAEGAHPLVLGDSDKTEPGEWVVAIGSPFGLGSSMTAGIVSAVGRTIPSGAASFSIPQAIQTDAAVNPGNSGGPLLNMNGEVIGVNAQIAAGSGGANAGVGFAIPSSIVRLVAPALIEAGSYAWPWLGIEGGDVNLMIVEANDLQTQRGAYVDGVVPDSPSDAAGLQGSSGTVDVDELPVPVGGDVIIEVDGTPVADFSDLLVEVAMRQPGDDVDLTIIRGGQRQQVTVTLARRPSNFQP